MKGHSEKTTTEPTAMEKVLATVYLAGTENGLGRAMSQKEIAHRRDAFIKANPACGEALAKIKQIVNEPAKEYICCEELGKALGDHRGLYEQTIGSLGSDELDAIICYVGGDYKVKNPIAVQYCPFCGKPRRRASEYTKGKKND